MWGQGYMGWGSMGLGMALIWLIPLGLLIWIALKSVGFRDDRGSLKRDPTALEVLNMRYAKGEIDRDEYLQRKADLEKQGH